MHKFQFIGRVLPEKFPISIEAPEISVRNPKNGLEVTLGIKIEKSDITIEGVTNRYEEGDFGLLLRRSLHFANSAVGVIGFATGVGFRAILDAFVAPDGTRRLVLPQEKRLIPLCKSFSLTEEKSFDAVFRKVATTPKLFLALNDLIAGLYQPDEGPIVCARAIETIRRIFAPKDAKPAEQWSYLHKALRVTKEYLAPITDISAGPRHGDRTVALDGNLPNAGSRHFRRTSFHYCDLLYCYDPSGWRLSWS
jgi:hypothetical protein